MALKLYSTLGSPAARASILTLRALGLKDKIQIINVNLVALDHLKPEYVEKNPLHTVPMLEDGNFILYDSHAINAYLVNKYADNDALYPKDPQKRALVDSMAHFDTGYLFARVGRINNAIFMQDKSADFNQMKIELAEVYDLLELILQKRIFVAGEQLTIADFSIVATLSNAEVFCPVDAKKHPKITAWNEKMKQLPYYSINEKGSQLFRELMTNLSSKL
ncbi:unnamed protein product [Ceutorhynchus assimilis]|uniref:Glutathione S-transferase n=1 Tax=Ceutorhynchus assimilis TaxID=467358 RepID=A0A9N9MHC0_9CUCU|nr:unnamed protein product [Ceutorhynchus assimilis]